MTPCRLLLDGPHGGAWNMALDEVLLRQAADEGIASLRVYQWTPATVSLGYFQKADLREKHRTSRLAPLVRRASGGGALVHDRELTYSVALPAGHHLARGGEALYLAVHQLLVHWLNKVYAPQGGTYELCERPQSRQEGEPWLCFLRRARGDVVYRPPQGVERNDFAPDGRFKVCGSAQRRRGSAVLQHGSLILERSAVAPEIAGIGDFYGETVVFDEVAPPLIKLVATRLRLEGGDVHGVDPHLAAQAEALASDKFERAEWNLRR
jgi:lipoyl(octanoyl) transferase